MSTRPRSPKIFRKGWVTAAQVAAIFLCRTPALADPPQRNSQTRAEILIDRLTGFSPVVASNDPQGWMAEFLAVQDPDRFIASQPMPKRAVDPNLRKLVQMGSDALPALIRHLTDDRKTKFKIVHANHDSMRFGADYEPRYADRQQRPDLRAAEMRVSQDTRQGDYALRVGDICYVAIGQIVNRQLEPFGYPNHDGVEINSPVHCPELAAAVAKDWSGLTRQRFLEYLTQEAGSFRENAAAAAERLLYYDPKGGRKVILALLHRKPYAYREIWASTVPAMLATDDPAQWQHLKREAIKRFGRDAAKTVPYWIHWDEWETELPHPPEKQARAQRILKSIYPEYRPHQSTGYPVVDPFDQGMLIVTLQPVHGKDIDRAVQEFFRKTVRLARSMDPAKELTHQILWGFDYLEEYSYDRMIGKGFEREYVDYLSWRIAYCTRWSKEEGEQSQAATLTRRLQYMRRH